MHRYAVRERGFIFFLARFARAHREHGENNCFCSDSLIPLKGGTGIPNQNNHQSLTGHMI